MILQKCAKRTAGLSRALRLSSINVELQNNNLTVLAYVELLRDRD